MWLIEADSLECGFRANNVEVARVSVLAHKLPESDLVAQHLKDFPASCWLTHRFKTKGRVPLSYVTVTTLPPRTIRGHQPGGSAANTFACAKNSRELTARVRLNRIAVGLIVFIEHCDEFGFSHRPSCGNVAMAKAALRK
jgi:hypothetical protein